MIAPKGTPIQGVTLYSFTRAFHGREYDLDQLIRKTAAEGFGPGLEVIGFSSFRVDRRTRPVLREGPARR